jgi:hypothetical protein
LSVAAETLKLTECTHEQAIVGLDAFYCPVCQCSIERVLNQIELNLIELNLIEFKQIESRQYKELLQRLESTSSSLVENDDDDYDDF